MWDDLILEIWHKKLWLDRDELGGRLHFEGLRRYRHRLGRQNDVTKQLTHIQPREKAVRGRHKMVIFIADYAGGIWNEAVHGAMRAKGGAQDAGLGYEGTGTYGT